MQQLQQQWHLPRKSLKKYERDLLSEYQRKGRPADGLNVQQLNIVCSAWEQGQDCYSLELDSKAGKWILSNGEDDMELEGVGADEKLILGIDPETHRCTVERKDEKRKAKRRFACCDTLLQPIISGEDVSRDYLKDRQFYGILLPPDYDALRLDIDNNPETDDSEGGSADDLKSDRGRGSDRGKRKARDRHNDDDDEDEMALLRKLQKLKEAKADRAKSSRVCACGLPNKTCGTCGLGYGQKAAPRPPSPKPPSDSEDEKEPPAKTPEPEILDEPWLSFVCVCTRAEFCDYDSHAWSAADSGLSVGLC